MTHLFLLEDNQKVVETNPIEGPAYLASRRCRPLFEYEPGGKAPALGAGDARFDSSVLDVRTCSRVEQLGSSADS